MSGPIVVTFQEEKISGTSRQKAMRYCEYQTRIIRKSGSLA